MYSHSCSVGGSDGKKKKMEEILGVKKLTMNKKKKTGHRSASFLPWHRWTLHVFENILKDKCGFPRGGTIP